MRGSKPIGNEGSTFVQAGREVQIPCYEMVTRSSSYGQIGCGVVLTTHPLLAPKLSMGRISPLPPFCAYFGMLRGDLSYKI